MPGRQAAITRGLLIGEGNRPGDTLNLQICKSANLQLADTALWETRHAAAIEPAYSQKKDKPCAQAQRPSPGPGMVPSRKSLRGEGTGCCKARGNRAVWHHRLRPDNRQDSALPIIRACRHCKTASAFHMFCIKALCHVNSCRTVFGNGFCCPRKPWQGHCTDA